MTQSLLAISIGPVQEFIAASRKARDLWRGSSLLSDVCRAAGAAISANDVTFIFPSSDAVNDGKAAVANKLLLWIDGDTQRAADLASEAEKAAHGMLEREWSEVWTGLTQRAYRPNSSTWLNHRLDVSLARAQIQEFLEFYAAWWPIQPGPHGYANAREQVDLLLAGRKALRNFAHPAGSQPGRAKSSLDPTRDSIISRRDDDVNRALHLSGVEELDAISVIKRLSKKHRMISTSRVAMDPLIRRLGAGGQGDDAGLKKLVELAGQLGNTNLVEKFPVDEGSGLEHFSDFPFDCQLMYGLPRKAEPGRLGSSESTLTDEEWNIANQFFACARDLWPNPPTSYAILVADGDYMGRAIDTLHDHDDHIRFSNELTGFASRADEIVQRYYGALLYSGGDDVVAFLPTDTAIPCAAALRTQFALTMEQAFPNNIWSTEQGSRPTLSAGIAIVHFREHLQVAMSWARDAEKRAKSLPQKNALAVHLHTRSGGKNALKVVHSWDDRPVATVWRRWTDLHRDNAIPDAAAFELRALHRELVSMQLDDATLHALLGPEVERILNRKRGQAGTAGIPKETMDRIVESIGGTLNGLAGCVDELLIARRLAVSIDVGGKTASKLWDEVQPTARENGSTQ